MPPANRWTLVGEALVRYINQGITLRSVNLPEVNLRSLTLDEPDHARVRCHESPRSFKQLIASRSSTYTRMYPASFEKVGEFCIV